ncbi:hypothetical protein [Streptomyces griseosporeus]|uniref:hypothetical protein n=1 Tax=Streptomyces griseosporeus TaxID=1910 RepID=UPI0037005D27
MGALSDEAVLEGAMTESVPVRCPACRRERLFTAPSYPCACGAPVAPPLDPTAPPTPVTHRSWEDQWVAVRCPSCDRRGQWPRPELGCPCGAVLRIAVTGTGTARDAETEAPARADDPGEGAAEATAPVRAGESGEGATTPRRAGEPGEGTAPLRAGEPAEGTAPTRAGAQAEGTAAPARAGEPEEGATAQGAAPEPRTPAASERNPHRRTAAPVTDPARRPGREAAPSRAAARRGAFRPVPVRTARDAVTVAALYLRWLGHDDVRRADQRPPSGIGLAARGMVAQVDPAARPASPRDVECLWLTAMTESADCVYFSLSGYTAEARARADGLGVPLFVLAPTGNVLPVNAPARTLASGDPR